MELSGISREYVVGAETVHALDHVDLTIGAGEYVSIMGPSGSGKSTLMNLIGCLDTPSRGSYLLNGKQVSRMNDNELLKRPEDPRRAPTTEFLPGEGPQSDAKQ